MNYDSESLYQHDRNQTLGNRERLRKNANLMFWYQELYKELFSSIPDISNKQVLEIGSGASPLKNFLPTVITSDVLNLEHLDIVFDCHQIAHLKEVPDNSIDIVTLTNVLHHLRDPLQFLRDMTKKLAKGGQVFLVEPYFSFISYPLYKLLHHEPVNFKISRPVLAEVQGPLSSSNQAIPYMIFFLRPDWLQELSESYVLKETRYGFFTSLAYMASGGISRIIPIPSWIYRPYFVMDRMLAQRFPKMFASFFSVRLVVKG